MDIMKIAILGIVGVLLAIPLKVHKAEYAMFLSMAVCICIFVYIISKIQIIYNYVNSLKNLLPIDGKYIAVILKMIGIKDKKEIDRVLKIVELDKVKAPYKNFSLGMRQRLGIANAIMGSPEILILDEPTNGLDPQGIADVRHLIQKLNSEYSMTIIVSSHILGELQNTAHRFGIVDQGRIAKEISMADLSTNEKAVRICVDNLEKAESALEAAGVKILGTVNETKSLEEYYFDLVGGKE